MAARAPWTLLVALLVLVSLAVYGLARWRPFEPSAAPAAAVAEGDAAAGERVFGTSCAVCHGEGREYSARAVHNISDPYVTPYLR